MFREIMDSNIEQARSSVLSWYKERLNNITTVDLKDPKTRLQEYLQAKKYDLPCYEIMEVHGQEHAQTFHVNCVVKEINMTVSAVGSSRRAAEQKSAELMLEQIK